MFRKSKLENQKSKFDLEKNTASHINGKYSNGTVGSCLRRQYVKSLVALEKSKGTPQYYYYCFTADLTVMDSSQRVWASTFYSLPSVLSTCGWTVPYLASMLVVVTVVLLFLKEKSEGA